MDKIYTNSGPVKSFTQCPIPTPYALRPTPYTPLHSHPTPYTIRPKPENLNPTPQILIAMNPFKWLPIYGENVIKSALNLNPLTPNP